MWHNLSAVWEILNQYDQESLFGKEVFEKDLDVR